MEISLNLRNEFPNRVCVLVQMAAGRIEWYVRQLSFRLAHKPERCCRAEWSKKTNTGKSKGPLCCWIWLVSRLTATNACRSAELATHIPLLIRVPWKTASVGKRTKVKMELVDM